MTGRILVENGAWRNVTDVLRPARPAALIEPALVRVNRAVREQLRLRGDPLELRYQHGQLQVRARSVVGTLVVGRSVIEVAPKFVPPGEVESSWDTALLALLRIALPNHVAIRQSTYVGIKRHTLVDLLGYAFVDSVEQGLRDQLIHTYRVREETLPVMRGRLNLRRQVRSVVVRPHLLECDVDELHTHNEYNDLLKWGGERLARAVTSPILRRRIGLLNERIPGVPSREFALRQKVVVPPSHHQKWAPALEVCSLLSAGTAHTAGYGDRAGSSLVFNMERIFEHFVEGTVKRAAGQIGRHTYHKAQVTSLYGWSIGGQRHFHTKPDNIIGEPNGYVCVVDAKYKRLSDSLGTRNRKPLSQDLYELIAAMTSLRCTAGLLVFPKTPGLDEHDDLQTWKVEAFGVNLVVGAITIDLMSLGTKEGRMAIDATLARRVAELIDRKAEIDALS